MKPPLSYYGGKQRLASRIVNLIESMPHTVYSEPFCGGAAVLFNRTKPVASNSTHYREAVNDKNDLISNFYRVAKLQPTKLFALIDATLYSQIDYKKSIAICKSGEGTELEKAWAVFVNCNMSFANKMNGGWGTQVKSQNSVFTWQARKTRLEQQLDRLKDVHIGNEDAIRFIDRWDSPTTLHYCDPPYVDTNCGHYGGYGQENLDKLIDKLSNCLGSFVLSGYSLTEAPHGWSCIEIPITSSASGKGKVGRDRTDGVIHDYGDRSRVEKLWYLDRSKQLELQQSSFKQLELVA
jgi:DNA adenine methylase